jgi:hypothetical protein
METKTMTAFKLRDDLVSFSQLLCQLQYLTLQVFAIGPEFSDDTVQFPAGGTLIHESPEDSFRRIPPV